MISINQNIPCPVCQTSIPINVQQLLQGVSFTCPTCFATIGLQSESKPTDATDKLNESQNPADDKNPSAP